MDILIDGIELVLKHSPTMRIILSMIPIAVSVIPVHAQASISVYTGTSYTRHSDLRIQQPSTNTDATFRGVSWNARAFSQAPYYGIRLSRFFNRSPDLGISFDYTHYKVYARTDQIVPINGIWNVTPVNESARLDRRVQDFNISHGVNMGGINLLYRWMKSVNPSFPRGRVQPYVGGGPVYYVPHSESTINNRTTAGRYQGSGFGYQLLGGLQYGLVRYISLFAEIKFNAGDARVDTADQGHADTKLHTLQTLVGFSFTF